jgi:hypothetical protein
MCLQTAAIGVENREEIGKDAAKRKAEAGAANLAMASIVCLSGVQVCTPGHRRRGAIGRLL